MEDNGVITDLTGFGILHNKNASYIDSEVEVRETDRLNSIL